MLKYLKFRRACDAMFGVFMVTWFAVRHIAYLAVCYSIARDYLRIVTFGCFKGSNANQIGPFPPPDGYSYLLQPFLDPNGLACQTRTTTGIFVFLLLFLQGILVVWFGMIIGVAYRVLTGRGSEDPRSDDEQDDEEDVDDLEKEESHTSSVPKPQYIEVPAPLEEEVDIEEMDLVSSKRSRSGRRGGGTSSGVRLPHDRKELLGRIGCDKGA